MAFNVKLARLLTCLILLFKWSTVVLAEPCEDLDTHACELFEKSEPNICQDPVFSQSTCQRYCNLCPLQCYSCDTFDCNTTVTCSPGEKCLKHIVISTLDGQKDILTKCSSIEECDGRLSSVVIGRRQIGKRNHAVTCCSSDLCNDPAATSGSTGAVTQSPDTTTGAIVNTTWHNVDCPSDHVFDISTLLCMKVMDTDWETFDNAQTKCQAIGDNIIMIDTHEKNVFVEDVIRHISNESVLMRGYWIGGRNNGNSEPKQFKWMNGTPFQYSNWVNGDPDVNPDERCVVMLGPDMYKWSDSQCSNTFHYICERRISQTTPTATHVHTSVHITTTSASPAPTTKPTTRPVCDISGGFKLLIDGLTRLCIKLHSHHTDWSHARMMCTRERSDLVVVDTKHKFRMVFNETHGHEFWVGAVGPNSASNYTWVNGHLLSPGSSLWNVGQPNDHKEACVNTLANHPLLHDAPCTETHRFVCERSLE